MLLVPTLCFRVAPLGMRLHQPALLTADVTRDQDRPAVPMNHMACYRTATEPASRPSWWPWSGNGVLLETICNDDRPAVPVLQRFLNSQQDACYGL